MTLAIFEAYYSRPIAPTRRVALGKMMLPVDPAPGFGGVLLGGIMARFVRELDADLDEELDALVDDLESAATSANPGSATGCRSTGSGWPDAVIDSRPTASSSGSSSNRTSARRPNTCSAPPMPPPRW